MKKVKSILKKIIVFSRISRILYPTQWYKSLFVDSEHEIFPDAHWLSKHSERDFDIVNLGSSAAKWAFDYEAVGVRGMNWAQQPQTLRQDYRLLRNFHSILHKGGYVIITIVPFSGLEVPTNLSSSLKYLKLETKEPIEEHLLEQAKFLAEHPIFFKKIALRALLRYLLRTEKKPLPPASTEGVTNPMSEEELEQDALRWIRGWKQHLHIDDFDAPLTPRNREGRNIRVALMRELIDFCHEKGYRPVYLIPPVTKHLSGHFSARFAETYTYGFLKEVDRDIPLLDYSQNPVFHDDQLYFNSFFLNRRGRTLFTRAVMTRLRLLTENGLADQSCEC